MKTFMCTDKCKSLCCGDVCIVFIVTSHNWRCCSLSTDEMLWDHNRRGPRGHDELRCLLRRPTEDTHFLSFSSIFRVWNDIFEKAFADSLLQIMFPPPKIQVHGCKMKWAICVLITQYLLPTCFIPPRLQVVWGPGASLERNNRVCQRQRHTNFPI
jgi:hypothetical protein